ncbi:MAG: alanine racemase [Puniceicoccaceae bacterium]
MTEPGSRVTLEINLSAIRRNYRRIQKAIAPLGIMAVLKANAYGLGVRAIAQVLKQEGVAAFGVAEAKEACAIADLGVPILVLGGLLPEEIPSLLAMNAWMPVQSQETGRRIQEEAARQHRIARCHVLIDTGMGRLGLLEQDCIEALQSLAAMPNLQIDGLYSHFPDAYSDRTFSEQQIQKLLRIAQHIRSRLHISLRHLHISNSDGLHNIPEASHPPFTLVRTGINLYGCFDLEGRQTLPLEEVITIRSRLASVRSLPAGSTIGYGKSCILQQPTLVGTVAIGYADGLPLHFQNGGYLKVRGKPCAVLGRTSMDYTTIDLSMVPDAKVGDAVTCLGEGITTADWARAKGTIPYEVICSIGNRVERIAIEE